MSLAPLPKQAGAALRGRQIVVARPAGQAEGLRSRLAAAGAQVLLFPGLSIEPCPPDAASSAALDRLAQADWAVFVSANAVEHGLAAVAARGGWPDGVRTAAVGAATAAALERAGLGPVLRPLAREDSEGLLAHPGWGSLTGAQVLIFRGQGGRETLAEGLRRAGAEVRYAEVYRRLPPRDDPAPLRAALLAGSVAAICALSAETLHNLFEVCGSDCHPALRATAWLVPHPRVAEAARSLGLDRVLQAAGSSDDALLQTLFDHFDAGTA